MRGLYGFLLALNLYATSVAHGQGFWVQANVPGARHWALCLDSIGYIYAMNDSGTYKSINNGISWALDDTLRQDSYSYFVKPNGDRFAATRTGGLKRRLAQSDAWTTVLNDNILNVVASENGVLFAGGSTGVFRSTNNGDSWSSLGLSENKVTIHTTSIPGLVFATHSSGIHKTTNGGAVWTRVASSSFVIGDIAEADSGYMYAAAVEDSGIIMRSTDFGASWQESQVGSLKVRNVVVDSRGHIFTFQWGHRVILRSTDHGLTWNEWTESANFQFTENAKLLMTISNHILLGAYVGLYRTHFSTVVPSLTTQTASGVTETGAALNGTINPNGILTSWAFQFGETSGYGTATAFANAGSGQSNIPVVAIISGLTSGRAYHFRLIATTVSGDTIYGNDMSFTTVITIPPPPTLVFPLYGAIVQGPPVRTQWRRTDPRSDRFWIELATDSLFAFRQLDSSVTDTSMLWSGLTRGQTYWWKVRGFNVAGWGPFSMLGKFSISTTDVQNRETTPLAYRLEQNYPNPWNPSTTIRYSLSRSSFVKLNVYNTLGQTVSNLIDEQQDSGYHELVFHVDELASGVYYYRLEAGNYVATKTMLLLR